MNLLLGFMANSVKPVSGKQIVAFFNSQGYTYQQVGGVVGSAVKQGLLMVVSTRYVNNCKVNYFF